VNPSLTLHLHPSPLLLAMWCTGCAAIVAALVWVSPGFPAMALLLMLSGLALLFHQGFRRLQLRHPLALTCLRLEGDGAARWQCQNQAWNQGRLGEISVIHPWLMIIALQSGQQRRWLLLASGSAEPGAMRKLRVLLLSLSGRGVLHGEPH
jgi:hypothetical protein